MRLEPLVFNEVWRWAGEFDSISLGETEFGREARRDVTFLFAISYLGVHGGGYVDSRRQSHAEFEARMLWFLFPSDEHVWGCVAAFSGMRSESSGDGTGL